MPRKPRPFHCVSWWTSRRWLKACATSGATPGCWLPVLLKGGIGIMGANWVIFPIMGERVFPVGSGSLGAARAAVLGMSMLMSARGVGALTGPLFATKWAGGRGSRMRRGILIAFIAGATGYMLFSVAPILALACAAVAMAHGGGSTVWVFSTTLLQRYSYDKFRGRVQIG